MPVESPLPPPDALQFRVKKLTNGVLWLIWGTMYAPRAAPIPPFRPSGHNTHSPLPRPGTPGRGSGRGANGADQQIGGRSLPRAGESAFLQHGEHLALLPALSPGSRGAGERRASIAAMLQSAMHQSRCCDGSGPQERRSPQSTCRSIGDQSATYRLFPVEKSAS
jgi:hypothetical protein